MIQISTYLNIKGEQWLLHKNENCNTGYMHYFKTNLCEINKSGESIISLIKFDWLPWVDDVI